MAAIGSPTLVSVASTSDVLQSPAASAGTTPYIYNWYRSTATGFTPGSGNAIGAAQSPAGNAVPAAFPDSGLTPGTQYYYKVIVTDSAGTPATATSAQLAVSTLAPSLSQNQFAETPFLGQIDLRFNPDTIAAAFDPAGSGSLVGGQAVKFTTNANGIPLVVPCTAAADVAAGFVNYDIKTAVYSPGDKLEISMASNVMFLYAALAINRGQQVTSLPAGVAGGCNGGVIPAVGGSLPLVGWSLDTKAIGQLCRIFITTPAYTLG